MMNKLKCGGRFKSNTVISLIFIIVLVAFLASFVRYWNTVLDPRLRLASETHAEALSQSQTGVLLKAIETKETHQRNRVVKEVIEEILLVSDPSINEPFIKGLSLQVDYDVVDSEQGSLDFSEGVLSCENCFRTEVAILGVNDELLAIATFNITDGYYRLLSHDMKDELYNQAYITVFLFSSVWLVMLVLVSRLHQVNENIETSDRAKTRFMANVTHELRTPLNAILGYTQLFKKDKEIMSSYGKGVETIHRSADHLLMLINDILDFSKVDAEGIKLHQKETLLNDFLNTLMEMTEVRATLKDINFDCVFSGQLPDLVLVDEKRLRQVLLNLLNNAVKFTSHGTVTFSVSLLPEKNTDKYTFSNIRFSISDTGIGIPKSHLKEIFVPYQQVENKITRAEGSGLGLTISKNIIEKMGATLKVDSTLGKGSVFWFDLKLPLGLQSSTTTHLMNRNVVGYSGAAKRILSIDDNEFNRDVIRQYLNQYDFIVDEASSGEIGLQQLDSEKPDLVLLDILMPDMDGFDVIKQIRSNENYREIPIIALTAAVQPEIEEKVNAYGFSDILIKPIVEDELLDSLKTQLALEWVYEEKTEIDKIAFKQSDFTELPDQHIIDALKEHATKHNILAIREMMKTLEQEPCYQQFVEKLSPLARNYQFVKLVEILNKIQT